MIDCHQHLRVEDLSTEEKRQEYAEWTRAEMDSLGIDRFVLMPSPANTIEKSRENVQHASKLVEEHPDLGYIWNYLNPSLEGAAEEFRRSVEEDNVVGLKHHSNSFQAPLSDPEVDPLLSAATEMGVPVIAHVTQRTRAHREEYRPYETQTEHVREAAERYPDLDIISGHIGAGGDWERRIRNLTDLDNVYLDISGTECSRGQVEMAAEYLGTDRLLFGTDGWLLPDIGKLEGADLTAEEKAEIAYNMEHLIPDHVPNKLSPAELEERKAAAVERFERFSQPREETIVETNAFLGEWPYREVEGRTEELLDRMDREGIDKALVSSLDAVHRRNVPKANHQLLDRIEGHEDRLIPVATVDATYTKWEENLDKCVDRGAKAVKILPMYHGYDLDEAAPRKALTAAAERDLPVIICSTLEDNRMDHPTHTPRGTEDSWRYVGRWSNEQLSNLIGLLKDCPDTDVIIDHAWTNGPRILEEARSHIDEHRMRNAGHEGRILFNINGLFIYYQVQADRVPEEVGIEHLAFSAPLPFKVVQSYYGYLEHLPVDEGAKDKVRAGNVLELID